MKTEIAVAAGDLGSTSQLPSDRSVQKAVELLANGEIVALPTETVYGLAADALAAEAVTKIFEAKERPRFDPLIVHLPQQDWLERVATVTTEDQELVSALVNAFWPGPLTLVLPKRDLIPDIVTAGLDTVAVRISAHPVFHAVIRNFGRPLAAPSANRFGRISPTQAQHVFDELEGRIPLILDAGPTSHGLESTIVEIRAGKIVLLRRGPVTEERLQELGFDLVPRTNGGGKISAPGQLPSHYAPKTPLRFVEDAELFSPPGNQRAGLLAWNAVTTKQGSLKYEVIRCLSEQQDLHEAAANLFRYLRELDQAGLDLIVAEKVPEHGLGTAINDRLRRASRASEW
ncbi:MAG: L-threonylcarbamoyladenylate synthase [Verrucomicrobiota bacterium]